jgi:hypothetical protein
MPWINPDDFVDTSEDEFVTLAELDTRTQGYGRGRGRGRKTPTRKGKPGTYSDTVSDPRGSSGSRRDGAPSSPYTIWYEGSEQATEQFWQDFAAGGNGAPPPPSGSLGAASPPALQVLFGNRPRRGQKKKKPKGR